MTKGNLSQTSRSQAQNWASPWHGLAKIGEAAKKDRNQRFTSLMHHLSPRLLLESYRCLKRDAALGVDEQSWQQYQVGLTDRLLDLHERVQSGKYKAQPSKRIYLPKGNGARRPIGIASLEDKIVQGAVVRILEQIYEVDFRGFSYGFRPGKNQHNALDAVWQGINKRRIKWILDADIKSFFDTIDHECLLGLLSIRIADQRLLKLLQKWLIAGISEDGEWSATDKGSPQGAIISPLISNVYLHYVYDQWVDQWRNEHCEGDVIIVRYADDSVVGFQRRADARRFLRELKTRFAQYELSLNAEKTRLIEFGLYAADNRKAKGKGKPETFDFLGFTHICGQTRKDKRFIIKRTPIAKRQRRKLKEIKNELMRRRHELIADQGEWLRSVIQGYVNYYAVPGTFEILNVFRTQMIRMWLRALRRRSHKAQKLTWARFDKWVKRWIPSVTIVHPYPNKRLILKTQGRSRME